MSTPLTAEALNALAADIRRWAAELGFQSIGTADVDLTACSEPFKAWLAAGFHGEMRYMAKHVAARLDPTLLVPDTVRAICARMDYWPADTSPIAVLKDPTRGYVSRYAVGRDYHRVVRSRLARLAKRINAAAPGHYRAFTDSAPVLEKPLAAKAGLGWVGKHTLLLDRDAGSYFFLGEIYTDLPLPLDQPDPADHCGRCTACINVCPTGAIVAPRQLDARRCISYLTIELKGAIPLELRPMIGNRIFGCDDCQLYCPWNRFATRAAIDDFNPRPGLAGSTLLELFAWDEPTFLARTEGTALRRIHYGQWLRNVAVALGNAPYDPAITAALEARLPHLEPMPAEHVYWAIEQQRRKRLSG